MYKINSIKLAINYHTIYHVISFFMADRDRNIAIDRNIGYWSVYKGNSTKKIFSIKYMYNITSRVEKRMLSTTSE